MKNDWDNQARYSSIPPIDRMKKHLFQVPIKNFKFKLMEEFNYQFCDNVVYDIFNIILLF